jgi:hypothetical protein
VNAKLVDSLLEALIFPGEEGGMEGQPPSHPRFKWKPPGEVPASQAAPTRLGKPSSLSKPGFADPEDRVGKYSMSDLLPKSEVATSDDLIDFFARIRDAKSGKKKQAWQKEFDAHRTEFESKLHAFVDRLLTEVKCDKCGEEVGDRYVADKGKSGQKINVCGKCYMGGFNFGVRQPGAEDSGTPFSAGI